MMSQFRRQEPEEGEEQQRGELYEGEELRLLCLRRQICFEAILPTYEGCSRLILTHSDALVQLRGMFSALHSALFARSDYVDLACYRAGDDSFELPIVVLARQPLYHQALVPCASLPLPHDLRHHQTSA